MKQKYLKEKGSNGDTKQHHALVVSLLSVENCKLWET